MSSSLSDFTQPGCEFASSGKVRQAACTLVLDVGKTRSKLLAIDDQGALLGDWQQASASIDTPQGYRALDTAATRAWLCEVLGRLGALRQRIGAIVPISHGAAIAGIDEGAWYCRYPTTNSPALTSAATTGSSAWTRSSNASARCCPRA